MKSLMLWFRKIKPSGWPKAFDGLCLHENIKKLIMLDFNTDTLHEQIEARYILLPLTAALKQAGISCAINDARWLSGIALGRDDAAFPHEVIARWAPSQNRLLDAMRYRRS